jgi:hypothetical protein
LTNTIFSSNFYLGEATASPQKIRSQPSLRIPTYSDPATSLPGLNTENYKKLNFSSLTSSQLLQRLEQSLVVLLNTGSQYVSTASMYLSPSTTQFELRVLMHNLHSLVSQLQSVLAIIHVYTTYYQSTETVLLLLPSRDRKTLSHNLIQYCSNLWDLLHTPSSTEFRLLTAYIITNIDSFLTKFSLCPITTEELSRQKFSRPSPSATPSVIHQIAFTEIITDPYLRSLQQNYYYPLSQGKMATETNNTISHMPMSVDIKLTAPPRPSSPTVKKKITVEDSMEVISELILEIQSTEDHPVHPQPVADPMSASSS